MAKIRSSKVKPTLKKAIDLQKLALDIFNRKSGK